MSDRRCAGRWRDELRQTVDSEAQKNHDGGPGGYGQVMRITRNNMCATVFFAAGLHDFATLSVSGTISLSGKACVAFTGLMTMRLSMAATRSEASNWSRMKSS